MIKKLFVKNISGKTTSATLTAHFNTVGKVYSVRIVKVISFAKNPDYAYVDIESDLPAEDIVRKLSNTTLDESVIRVIEAHSFDMGVPHKTSRRIFRKH